MSYCEKCRRNASNYHKCYEFTFDVEYYGEMRAFGINAEDALLNIAQDYNDEGDLIDTEIVSVCDGVSYIMSAELDVKYRVERIGLDEANNISSH